MAEFIDLGETISEASPTSAEKRFFPSVHLKSDKVDRDVDVGDRLTLTIKARVSSIHKSLGQKAGFTFELLEMKMKDKDET